MVSMPEQNWVLKIDWKDGKGSGKVLWRLGKDGDFKAESKDPNPWFSYQHDAGFEPSGSDLLTLTDDGDASGKDAKTGSARHKSGNLTKRSTSPRWSTTPRWE